jgi:general L-amino acid transport system permease protein
MAGEFTMSVDTQARPYDTTLSEIKRDYFGTVPRALVSVGCLAIILLVAYKLVDWAIVEAVWTGTPDACREAGGACWAVIADRYRLIFFGLYPYEEQWRSAVACAAIVLTIVLSCVPFFWNAIRLAILWCLGFGIFYLMMKGGVFGLSLILENQWGGLALTMFVFSATVLLGMPLAVVLALLRRSRLPVIQKMVALLIDGVRSLPLVSILFTVAIILPFALPGFLITDQLYRVIFGSALFFSVYQAEILRGGMQALSAGQEEAAQALGLNYWQTVSRIVLPQAFRYALPPTINQVVVAFMETSLIVILGLFEVTASGNAAFTSGGWNSAYIEVYTFVALIYFTFTFSLSRYGAFLEKTLTRPSH